MSISFVCWQEYKVLLGTVICVEPTWIWVEKKGDEFDFHPIKFTKTSKEYVVISDNDTRFKNTKKMSNEAVIALFETNDCE